VDAAFGSQGAISQLLTHVTKPVKKLTRAGVVDECADGHLGPVSQVVEERLKSRSYAPLGDGMRTLPKNPVYA